MDRTGDAAGETVVQDGSEDEDDNTNGGDAGDDGNDDSSISQFSGSSFSGYIDGDIDPDLLDEQCTILAGNRKIWNVDGQGNSRSSYLYYVTDLDRNGRLELVVKEIMADAKSEFHIVEVNETFDGLKEVQIEYNGKIRPDVTALFRVYVTNEGAYYTMNAYDYTTEKSYAEEYISKMENGVIYAELYRAREQINSTYEYTFYDCDGNKISEDDYFNADLPHGIAEYEPQMVTMYDANQEVLAQYDGDISETDLYYFVQHGYGLFCDASLGMGKSNATFTIYTDPDSPEYQALKDVVVLNPEAEGEHIRYTTTGDISVGVSEAEWVGSLNYLSVTESPSNTSFFNRAYELIIDLSDDKDRLEAMCIGDLKLEINKANFGRQRGTYSIDVARFVDKVYSDEDAYFYVMGIVAYEVVNCGGKDEFTSNELLYWKTLAEAVTYLYDVKTSHTMQYFQVYLLYSSILSWDFDAIYYEYPDNEYFMHHKNADDGCEMDDYAESGLYGYTGHDVVPYCSYSEAMSAISDVDVRYDENGMPTDIVYSVKSDKYDENGDGVVVVRFLLETTDKVAFGLKAYHCKVMEE